MQYTHAEFRDRSLLIPRVWAEDKMVGQLKNHWHKRFGKEKMTPYKSWVKNITYNIYKTWLNLVLEGKLNTLNVYELDKYIDENKLNEKKKKIN